MRYMAIFALAWSVGAAVYSAAFLTVWALAYALLHFVLMQPFGHVPWLAIRCCIGLAIFFGAMFAIREAK